MVKPKTYLEHFALRVLRCAREDKSQIRRAMERFEAIGLDWHAADGEHDRRWVRFSIRWFGRATHTCSGHPPAGTRRTSGVQ
jgi:hypothetical protein